MPDTFPCICTEQKPRRIQCIPIKKRKLLLHRSLQRRIILRILRLFDLKIHMEFRPRCPAFLHLHMVPAIGNPIRDIRQKGIQLLRRNPLLRILCMVIVTIHHQYIRPDEIVLAAVILPVFRAHMVIPHRRLQFFRTVHLHPVRVKAVLCIPCHIRCLQNKPHFLTPPSVLP